MFKLHHMFVLGTLALLSQQALASQFVLKSNDIQSGLMLEDAQVFNGFGCHGKNISPELHWSGEPEGTRSFAVTVYDPSAPSISGWWHWTVVNISVQEHKLNRGAGQVSGKLLPGGAIQGLNDYGFAGFGGACPPEGFKAHPYIFTVWALDTDKLPVSDTSSGALVGYQLLAHKLATAQLTPVYGTR